MQIDINYKYVKNILNVFGKDGNEAFQKAFGPKERSFWDFTLSLIKKDPDKKVWDSVADRKWLEEYLLLFLNCDGVTKFTIDEWFNFLKNK